eukprot:gnl/TRDRNA2_/TRDRNA2_137654_c0_seq1.p1 gnl/TRDRNA2_/TRDRNA2_137654_c0~~gnl/TRDRNA2_/TRDRNA2_137654_c0_seq1.p1  ORF type:complete len:178 (-),score=36.92 gnl/TRDRNA2_/TRDRNA2_137654_c0_seq1:78-611(-)
MVMFKQLLVWVWTQPRVAFTWFLSVPGLMGLLLLGAGCGLWQLPPKAQLQLEAKIAFFLKHVLRSTGVALQSNQLLVLVGACKVLGTVALHGLCGARLEMLANCGFCILFVLVLPTHLYVPEAKDPKAVQPLVFLAIGTIRLFLPRPRPPMPTEGARATCLAADGTKLEESSKKKKA